MVGVAVSGLTFVVTGSEVDSQPLASRCFRLNVPDAVMVIDFDVALVFQIFPLS
jgi:hypothetical protein